MKRLLICTTLALSAFVAPSVVGVVSAAFAQTLDTGVGKKGEALPSSPAFAAEGGELVTMDNVVRADTAKYFAAETITTGPNAFRHERNGIDLKNQTVIRSNFDLVYSYGVWDASSGVTITVPEYDLLQLVHVLDENSVTVAVVYPGQTVELKPEQLSTGRHLYLFMRTQPRSRDDVGMDEMRKRQDAVIVTAGSSEAYVSPVKYDIASFNTLRDELAARATEGVSEKGFIDDISQIETPHYQIVNVAGWAGLPAKNAFYFAIAPGDEGAAAGKPASVTFTPPNLRYEDSGYWSMTIYSAEGWVESDPFVVNSRTATPNPDGTITISFNGDEGAPNNVKTPQNWNALFRSYLPVSVEEIVAYRDDFYQNHKIVSK